jgi:Rod binding domain-containing protein
MKKEQQKMYKDFLDEQIVSKPKVQETNTIPLNDHCYKNKDALISVSPCNI